MLHCIILYYIWLWADAFKVPGHEVITLWDDNFPLWHWDVDPGVGHMTMFGADSATLWQNGKYYAWQSIIKFKSKDKWTTGDACSCLQIKCSEDWLKFHIFRLNLLVYLNSSIWFSMQLLWSKKGEYVRFIRANAIYFFVDQASMKPVEIDPVLSELLYTRSWSLDNKFHCPLKMPSHTSPSQLTNNAVRGCSDTWYQHNMWTTCF